MIGIEQTLSCVLVVYVSFIYLCISSFQYYRSVFTLVLFSVPLSAIIGDAAETSA